MVQLINRYLTEDDIAKIARISTDGKRKNSNEDLIRILMKRGHLSVMEHAAMTFYVECPIYTARQWMRHRIGSFTEKSGRYSEMKFFQLKVDCDQLKKIEMEYEMLALFNYYDELIRDGMKKEQARQVLPLCTLTKFYWTINLRSLMNFLDLRMDPHAQRDIRENARQVFELFKKHYPTIADEWRKQHEKIHSGA